MLLFIFSFPPSQLHFLAGCWWLVSHPDLCSHCWACLCLRTLALGRGKTRQFAVPRQWIRQGDIEWRVHLHTGGTCFRSLHGSRESAEKAPGEIEKNSCDYRRIVDSSRYMCTTLADYVRSPKKTRHHLLHSLRGIRRGKWRVQQVMEEVMAVINMEFV